MLAVFALLFLAADNGRVEADRLFAAGHYDEAASAYVQLLQTNPNDLGLLRSAGDSYAAENRPALAIPYFKRALAVSPDDLASARQLAVAYSAINQNFDAQSLLAHVAELDPTDAVTWYRLGVVTYMTGFFPAALDDLDRALKLGFSGRGLSARDASQFQNRAETVRAITLVEMGRPEEAARVLPDLIAK